MNRRQRRSREAYSDTSQINSADHIPLSRPPPTSATTDIKPKTLYEIAAARQKDLARNGTSISSSSLSTSDMESKDKAARFVTVHPDGTISEDEDDGEDVAPDSTSSYPILDTLFLALPLSFLHFTLSVLAAHQYAQTLKFPPLIFDTAFVAFPFLSFLIHLCHGHLLPRSFRFPAAVGQLLYLIAANIGSFVCSGVKAHALCANSPTA